MFFDNVLRAALKFSCLRALADLRCKAGVADGGGIRLMSLRLFMFLSLRSRASVATDYRLRFCYWFDGRRILSMALTGSRCNILIQNLRREKNIDPKARRLAI